MTTISNDTREEPVLSDKGYTELCKKLAPSTIEGFWENESAVMLRLQLLTSDFMETSSIASIHIPSQGLYHAFGDEEVSEFLQDESRLEKFVDEVASAAMTLGMYMEKLRGQGFDQCVLISTCAGCNTPHDSGCCSHDRQDSSIPVRLDHSQPWHIEVNVVLHQSVTLLAVLGNLLTRDDCYKLVECLVPETAKGMSTPDFAAREATSGKRGFLPVTQLFALIDNAARLCPLAAQYAAACLSLITCRAPARTFATFALSDVQVLCEVIHRYIGSIFPMI